MFIFPTDGESHTTLAMAAAIFILFLYYSVQKKVNTMLQYKRYSMLVLCCFKGS